PTKHGPSLVAAPDNRTSNPVAKGSRVPACPVRACVRRRSAATIANDDGPAGLSTSATPTGLRALGGGTVALRRHDELPADEVDDLADRALRCEAGGLAVPAPARGTSDRRHIHFVVGRAQRDAARRAFVSRRLTDQRHHLGTLN